MAKLFLPASDWHNALKARFSSRVDQSRSRHPFSVTSFRDLPPNLHQPALTDDIFCLHRGGAKRVYRRRDGMSTIHDVPLGALTVMPQHRSADWRTEGPDDYVHITFDPRPFNELLISECGKSRDQIELKDDVGFVNPLLSGLAIEMLRVAGEGLESELYLDTLFTAFSLALLRHCSSEQVRATFSSGGVAVRHGGMAGWRLRQIVEFMSEHLSDEILSSDLVRVSGLSRAHFYRAFRQATGMTPGRYLERLRVGAARRSIERGDSLAEVVVASGFRGTAALSHAFRKVVNMTPSNYRRWYR